MADPEPASSNEASQVIRRFIQGNKRYVERREQHGVALSFPQLKGHLVEDMLRPKPVKAIVLLDARSIASAPLLLSTHPSETRSVRICGNVCGMNDGAVGACEFLTENVSPPVVLVLGDSNNDVVEAAVRVVMINAGRALDVPSLPAKSVLGVNDLETLSIVQQIMTVAEDALQERPGASFEKLCELASHLSVWHSIENLMSSSAVIWRRAKSGELEIHGAFLNNETGRIRFLGEHPSKLELLATPPLHESIRTADDPPVPAAEALAQLVSGNRRYAAGRGGQTTVTDKTVLRQLSTQGQNPMAVVIGCADSRAPTEILFDMRPGDLFVLRNAGNTCASSACSLIGSAEYAISALGSKLLVVTGHTQCGAVTGAVDMARSEEDDMEVLSIGHIGKVLGNIIDAAKEAVAQLPRETAQEQIKLASKYNVHNTMEKLITCSPTVRDGVISGDLQVHGAIYDLFSGQVNWLGQHPELEKVLQHEMSLHRWKVQPYVSSRTPHQGSGVAQDAIQKLKEGNNRFVDGNMMARQSGATRHPYALVWASSEIKLPIEGLFDTEPGEIVTQRSLGGLEADSKDVLTASLEYAVLNYQPTLLVILADSDSQLVDLSLEQISGNHAAPTKTMMSILADILVSAQRAHTQVTNEPDMSTATRQRRMKKLTVELNAFYIIEHLLYSRIIHNAVNKGELELHVGLLDEQSGEVEFIGQHPELDSLLKMPPVN